MTTLGSGKIRRMARHRLLPVICLAVCLGANACSDPQATESSGNVLSLDLGADHASLAEDLQRTAPAPEPRVPAVTPTPSSNPEVNRPPTPRPRPTPRPEFLVVHLADGQTLYALCTAKLGDGMRWREVAKLNGWSEAKAGNLRVGQAVKLPLR